MPVLSSSATRSGKGLAGKLAFAVARAFNGTDIEIAIYVDSKLVQTVRYTPPSKGKIGPEGPRKPSATQRFFDSYHESHRLRRQPQLAAPAPPKAVPGMNVPGAFESGGAFGGSAGAAGVQAQGQGTAAVKWQKTQGIDGAGANASQQGIYMAITHMPQYQNYSFEELRVQDYEANRKKFQGGNVGGFGQAAGFGAFGGGGLLLRQVLLGRLPLAVRSEGGGRSGRERLARAKLGCRRPRSRWSR